MKRFALVVLIAIAFSLAGCGGCGKADQQAQAAKQKLLEQQKLQAQIIDQQKTIISLQDQIKDREQQLIALQAGHKLFEEAAEAYAGSRPEPAPNPEQVPPLEPETEPYVPYVVPAPVQTPAEEPAVEAEPAPTTTVYQSDVVWVGPADDHHRRRCLHHPGWAGCNNQTNARPPARKPPLASDGRAFPPSSPPIPTPTPTLVIHNNPH